MEVLQIFGSWEQEIDLGFTDHKPIIPTLYKIPKLFTICLSYCDCAVIV